MKVEIFISTTDNGKFLDSASSLSEALLNNLEDAIRLKPENQNFIYLKEQFDKEYDKEDWVHVILSNHITLIHDFAKHLHLFDGIWPTCLLSKTKLGKAIVELLEYGEFRLVLTNRTWRTPDELYLDFELVSVGNQYNFSRNYLSINP